MLLRRLSQYDCKNEYANQFLKIDQSRKTRSMGQETLSTANDFSSRTQIEVDFETAVWLGQEFLKLFFFKFI